MEQVVKCVLCDSSEGVRSHGVVMNDDDRDVKVYNLCVDCSKSDLIKLSQEFKHEEFKEEQL